MDWTIKIQLGNVNLAVAAIIISFGGVLRKANLFQVSHGFDRSDFLFVSLRYGNAGACAADI
jgi:hypothetical protein